MSSSTHTVDVVVIGAGLAGLASAVELAARGLKVCVVDKNDHLGGKMNVLSVPYAGPVAGSGATVDGRFTFDMGPTIITLPNVLREIIARSGRSTEDYIDLVNLDPQWRCMYEDGAVLDLHQNVDTMAAALDKQFPSALPGRGYREFVEYSRRMLRLSEKVFFYKDVGSPIDMMRASPMGDPRMLADVLAMRMHSTMAATAHKYVREPHLQQLVEHFLQYVGSSPFLAPAILTLIAAAQVDQGCWYPMGGTRQVARTLARIGAELGVTYLTSTTVKRINADGLRATGVDVTDADGGSARTITARHIVSNCDVQRTLSGLLASPAASARRDKVASQYTPACSGVVLYLGLNRQYDHLLHHDFLFSRSAKAEFNDIYTRGEPAADPTLYLAVPSRTDAAQAPDGCESLYILVHTAYRRPHHDWLNADGSPGPLLKSYRDVIVNKLRRFGMEDVEQHIVVERYLTPTQIDQWYNAEGGAIYGLASHGRLQGGFKPRNRSLVLDNLYLAGGSVNPGPGVPMVMMSGVTAANALLHDIGIDPAKASSVSSPTATSTGSRPWAAAAS